MEQHSRRKFISIYTMAPLNNDKPFHYRKIFP